MGFRLFITALISIFLAGPAAAARTWTDSTGTFRVEAEFVTVKEGKVYLEKSDGNVIAVPVDRLSEADRAHLRSLEKQVSPAPTSPFETPPVQRPTPVKPAGPTVSRPSVPTNGPGSQDLIHRVRLIFEANCYRCHGHEGTNEGGFNFVMNLQKLATTYVEAGDPASSLLLERVTAKSDDDSVMPPPGETPRPSADDVATIRQWILAGAPAGATMTRDFITNANVIEFISKDLQATPERTRRFNRYFTLTHLHNAGISDDELQTYRHAFAKLINSLSWNSSMVLPKAIDPAETILRVDIRELNWTEEVWDKVVEANPYAVELNTTTAEGAYEAAGSRTPLVRADWFVFAAARPPLYHTILGIPESDRKLEELLHVNVEANIRQEQVARAGFNRSGVSQNNRLIERHRLPYGSYWKSYDFGGNVDRQNLFEFPLGPDSQSTSTFRHDGGEIIFTLPNGLQGYMLVDSFGRRIEKGPTAIVSDPQRADRAVINGLSCMSCHYAGMIPKADEIRPFVDANRAVFDDPDTILALYPARDALDQYFQEDGERFTAALEKIGLKIISRTGEPVSSMALRFEQELDLPLAAAELGLKPQEFRTQLPKTQTVARTFGPLLSPGGTIKRDAFVQVFATAMLEFVGTGLAANRTGRRPTVKIEVDNADKVGEVRRFPDMGWGIQSLAFSPDGALLAGGKQDRALLVFDVNASKRVDFHEKLGSLGQVTCVAFTPDGKKLLTGGYSGEILIWDVSGAGTLTRAGQFAGHTKEINAIAVSRDSQFALSGGRDEIARYWQIDTGRELHTIPGFSDDIKACHISSDGKLGLAADGKMLMHVDLRSGKSQRTVKLDNGFSHAAAFSPVGDMVVCSDGHDLLIWDTGSGGELPKLESEEMQWCVTFSPDGKRICSGGEGRVNIWDIKNRRRIAALDTGTNFNVQTLACSPDNLHIAAMPSAAGQDLLVFRLPKPDP